MKATSANFSCIDPHLILKKEAHSLSLEKTAHFLRLISELIKGSITLINCLESIERSELERSLKRAAYKIKEHLLAGGFFSDYFEKSTIRWQRSIYILINTGEKNGFFPSSLDRAAEMLRLQIEWKEQLRAQLAYPLLLLVSSLAILILYFFFIRPLFAEFLTDSHSLMKTSSDWAYWNSKQVLFCALFSTCLLLIKKVRESARAAIARLAFWRHYMRARHLSQLFDLLAQLLKEQKAFDQTWELIPQVAFDAKLNSELIFCVERMLSGQLPSEAFAQLKGMGELELQYLRIGEKTGQMTKALTRLSAHLHKCCQRKIKTLLAILQPALLVLLGFIITCIALLMMRPLQEMQRIDFP